MIERPEYFMVEGIGSLFAERYNFNVVFQLFLINQEIVIFCKMDRPPVLEIDIDFSHNWTLKGNLKQERPFFASNLMITQLNEEFIELISNGNAIIGEYFESTADKVIFPLYNLFNTEFETKIDDFIIKIKPGENRISENISKYWRIPQIGAELILEKEGGTINSFIKIAHYVTSLLSLGTGRQLSIGIQKFKSRGKSFTLIQNNFASPNYISPILLSNDLPSLLTTGIEILKCWKPDKFKDFRIILEYLNATDKGYVDDRLLNLVQSYEIVAHNWLKKDYNLPPELVELKQNLKSTIKVWKKQFPDYDPNGFWSGRIHKSLEWEKTVKLLENVIESQQLNIEKLNIDFNYLVELRHAVAHKGRFGNKNAFENLQNSQFALRLFLLKTFGFNGKVNDYRGKGWTEYKNINLFE